MVVGNSKNNPKKAAKKNPTGGKRKIGSFGDVSDSDGSGPEQDDYFGQEAGISDSEEEINTRKLDKFKREPSPESKLAFVHSSPAKEQKSLTKSSQMSQKESQSQKKKLVIGLNLGNTSIMSKCLPFGKEF